MPLDLTYRPADYFTFYDRGIALADQISGALRRSAYEQAVAAGDQETAEQILQNPTLSVAQRSAMASIHPMCMGGEYLPPKRVGEVEIARIVMRSTMYDTVCLYVRRSGGRLHYRMVDEFEGSMLDRISRTSSKPLTLKELADFFLLAWPMTETLEANFGCPASDDDAVHGFIVEAKSNFYAEFADIVHERIHCWLDDNRDDSPCEGEEDEGGDSEDGPGRSAFRCTGDLR
jgi:hypothetical protein